MIIVANTSRQHHRFFYRQPGRMQHSYVDIPSGRQAEIGKHFTAAEKESVISQLQIVGARSKDEIDRKPDVNFKGLVYSLVKPLTEDQILESAKKVDDGADIVSAQESIKSALGADEVVYGKGSKGRKNRETTIEVVATDPNGRPIDGGIDMNLTVTPAGEEVKLPGR